MGTSCATKAFLTPVVRATGGERELTMMRWGMPPPTVSTGRMPMFRCYRIHRYGAITKLSGDHERLNQNGPYLVPVEA
jgi:putative SOS response-associated peptidase YedK